MMRFVLAAAILAAFGAAPSLAGDMRAAATAPSNTAPPIISGTATQGSSLTTTSGSWSGDPTITFTYVWQRCDSGGSCSNIPGAIAATYTLQIGDVGDTIVVAVTAHNSTGAATQTSSNTAVVTGATPPAVTALPSISGTADATSTVTAANGTWTGTSPITFTYQWQLCNTAGGSCANISGATAQTFVVPSADVGHTLRVAVNATNAGGGAQAISPASGVIDVGAPVSTASPVVTGTAKQGQTLTATTGTWTGAGTLTFALQWWRCQPDGSNCSTIQNATSANYVLTAADVGWSLKMRVTATSSAGSTVAASVLTVAVVAAPVTTTTVTTTTAPSGTVKLPNGEISIFAANVPATDRLVLSSLKFSPTSSHKHHAVTASFKIVSAEKYDVSGAIVSIAPTHHTWAKISPATSTLADGTVVFTVTPTSKAPKSGRLTLTVTMRTPTGSPLAAHRFTRAVSIRLTR